MLPTPDELLELKHRLRRMRAYIASLNSLELTDIDSLIHVAEAELERLGVLYPQLLKSTPSWIGLVEIDRL
jgi:hypothetical protein